MTSVTAEERRDAAIAAVLEIGACVYGSDPLAHPDDPHTVVAYRLRIGQTDPAQADALADLCADTETALQGLIPWTPEPEVVPDEA